MPNYQSTDVCSLVIQLNELKSTFHHTIRSGTNMEKIRSLHAEIKELECYLTALQWSPNNLGRFGAVEMENRKTDEVKRGS